MRLQTVRFLLATVFLLCIARAMAHAQGLPPLNGWTSHTWNISDGLPDQSIEAIAQTPDGYLWLGTPHGLARYDGFEFEVTADKTHGTLQEFGVSCLLVSKDGDLWVGSIGGGITRISHNKVGLGYEPGSEGLTVRALYEDRNGVIWAATGHGLYEFSQGRFVQFTPLRDQVLTSISSDGHGGMWLAGAKLFHLVAGNVQNIPLPYGEVDEVIHGLAITKEGFLWIGTPHGLYEMQDGGVLTKVHEMEGHVRSLYTDAQGTLWIATSEQGLMARESNGRFVQAVGMDEPMGRAIRILAETSNGDVWAGTTAGLIRISPSGMNLYPISTAAGADFGSIFIDRTDSVWLSAGSLTRFKDGREAPIRLPAVSRAPMRAFFRDSAGASWVGTLGDGCYRIFQNRIQHFKKEQLIRGFLEGRDGAIWIATDAGMSRWKDGRFESFRNSATLSSGAVRAMTPAGDGSLWVGTAEGLYLIQDDRIVDPELAHLLRHQRIWALWKGKADMLWVGAESGLYVWHENRLTHISFDNQQAEAQPVLSILEDVKDRILLAQPGTVVRLKRDDLVRALRQSNRVPGSVIYEGKVTEPAEFFEVAKESGAELYGTIPSAAQADSVGGAWYASYLGLIHIGPESIRHNISPPPLVIKQVLVDGVAVQPDKLLTLSPAAKTVQIRAAPILLSSRPGLWMRSRLLGGESSWNNQSTIAVSSYNDLDPGRYTYRLEAGWTGAPGQSSIELRIWKRGPYYRRPWFIFVILAAIASLAGMTAWLIYRLKIHQLRLQFRAVTSERGRVAREIHDTLLQGCIAVYSLLETYLSIHDPDSEAESENSDRYLLDHARVQIVETIADARTAIWDVRHADSGITLNEVLRELLSRILSPTGIENVLDDGGEAIVLPSGVQYEIMMAARESILNAVSHGDPQLIVITMRKGRSGSLTVRISDNGRGFDTSSKIVSTSNHFGLAGLRERTAALGGHCEIESSPGKGTCVTIVVPAQALRVM